MSFFTPNTHIFSTKKKQQILNEIYNENDYVHSSDLTSEKGMAFSISESEFDMSRFSGRFKSFLKVSNPFHAFYSNSRIKEFQDLLKKQEEDEENYEKLTGSRKMWIS